MSVSLQKIPQTSISLHQISFPEEAEELCFTNYFSFLTSPFFAFFDLI